MQQPHRSPARRIGPYTVITRLDPTDPGASPVPEQRFIARSADGDRTSVVSVPLDNATSARFLVEAQASRCHLGPWFAPVTECADPGLPVWCARPYLPAVPLPTALAVHGGPFPDDTLRDLGARLAGTIAIAHASGLAYAGVSPASVLLAGDGPRLTCFGAVRTAAEDGQPRSGLPGLEPGSLPPEQAAGGRPRPPGDVYALGAVLAYAATGHTVPERDELPVMLRSLVPACLSRDPAARPRAIDVLQALSPDSPTSPVATVLDLEPEAHRMRLPGRVIAAIAQQSASVLAADVQRHPEADE
ncbi:serine/threonine protein kinase [Streptomyces sp. CB01580]|uniref:serine/threonine protein kinase n=1 Tax=Streptomyces sp. CB01580 TaxID=1703933 RepID=UPI00093BC53F|nr:serine/threonine protein kinase [Streptomyces sp. CB01580]OKJ41689.1 serine/threonine protein kinase [Streptomyces sp. CB01580]